MSIEDRAEIISLQVANLCILRPNLEEVLLIRREKEPYQGLWGMPGGKVKNNERGDLAGARELKEETGLRLRPKFSLGWCYERVWEGNPSDGGTVKYVFHIQFFKFVTKARTKRKSVEGELRWFRISDLAKTEIIPSDPLMIRSFIFNEKVYAKSDIGFKDGKYHLINFWDEPHDYN